MSMINEQLPRPRYDAKGQIIYGCKRTQKWNKIFKSQRVRAQRASTRRAITAWIQGYSDWDRHLKSFNRFGGWAD